MKDYTSTKPVFSENIPIVEEDDLVNAENNNAAAMQLLQNILVLAATKVNKENGKEQIGLGNADNTADMEKPVSNPVQAALDDLYEQLTAYTRQKIADLINGAPSNLDTLKEVSDAMAAHKSVMDALDAAIGEKANAAEFDSHVKDNTKHIAPEERTKWNDANTKKHAHDNKSVLDGITSTLISGWNAKMEKTGDSANNTVTFTSGDAANPTGWADIVQVASGEKHSSLGRKFSLAVKNIRYIYKLLTSGALSTLLGTNLTANRTLVANGNGKVAASSITATELGYLAGVTSGVQGQINELNTHMQGIGVLYKCSLLTPAHAPQKTMAMGSMELPAGTYIATSSAKHSKQGGICAIGIGTSVSALPADNGQMIYGHEAYDVNKGCVTTVLALGQTTIIYFLTWAASDFEITPISFNAIKIK